MPEPSIYASYSLFQTDKNKGSSNNNNINLQTKHNTQYYWVWTNAIKWLHTKMFVYMVWVCTRVCMVLCWCVYVWVGGCGWMDVIVFHTCTNMNINGVSIFSLVSVYHKQKLLHVLLCNTIVNDPASEE